VAALVKAGRPKPHTSVDSTRVRLVRSPSSRRRSGRLVERWRM